MKLLGPIYKVFSPLSKGGGFSLGTIPGNLEKKGFLLCLLIIFQVMGTQNAKAIKSGVPMEIQGTYVVYIVETRTFQATEKVRLLLDTMVITADSMTIDLTSRGLRAIGNIRVAPVLSSSLQTLDPVLGIEGSGINEVVFTEKQDGRYLEGDTLYFDLDRLEGVLFQSEKDKLTRQLFQGADLREVSSVISEVERLKFHADPRQSPINIVCQRLRVEDDGDFQAWNVQLFIKGKKALNVPYYSSASQISNGTGFALNRADYSSANKWQFGGQWRYKKHGKFRGLFNWGYFSRGIKKFSLGLTQNYAFGKKVSGTFNLTGLGNKGYGYGISLNARMGRLSQLTGDFRGNKGNTGQTVNMNYYRFSQNSDQQILYTSILGSKFRNASFSYSRRSLPFKPLGMTMDMRMALTANNQGKVASLSSNFYRSQMNLGKRSWVNLNGGMNLDLGIGHHSTSLGFSPRINTSLTYRLGKYSQVSLGQSLSYYKAANLSSFPSKGQLSNNSSLSLALGGTRKWSLTTSTGFDWRNTGWRSGTFNFSRYINKRMDFSHSLFYDLDKGEPVSDTWSVSYKILGVRAKLNWYDNTGEYAVSFDSPF